MDKYIKLSKLGRKPKYSQALIDKLVRVVLAGGNKVDAARIVGIEPETLSRWLSRYPELSQEIEGASARHRLKLVKLMFKHGKKNHQALAWLLERVHGDIYGSKAGYTGSGGVQIQIIQGGYMPVAPNINNLPKRGELVKQLVSET
jgi:hypothetical protein